MFDLLSLITNRVTISDGLLWLFGGTTAYSLYLAALFRYKLRKIERQVEQISRGLETISKLK